MKENRIALQAKLVGSLYIIDTDQQFVAHAASKSDDIQLWHQRYGHISKSLIVNTFKCKSVDGASEIHDHEFFCEPCTFGKTRKQPHHLSYNKPRTATAGHTFHVDLCGPMAVESMGHHRYFMLFKDEYSGYMLIFYMKEKSESYAVLQEFLNLIESQRKSVKIIRCDQGTEFGGQVVEGKIATLLRNKGIVKETSTAYCPQQNGYIERANQTVINLGRSMIHELKLGEKLWAETTNTAVYLFNRIGTATNEWKTAFELYFGTKPDVSNLRVFGCKCYAHVPKGQRTKWQATSKVAILIGYNEKSKSYRLYDSLTTKVFSSRDVVFNETIPHQTVSVDAELQMEKESDVQIVKATSKPTNDLKEQQDIDLPVGLEESMKEQINLPYTDDTLTSRVSQLKRAEPGVPKLTQSVEVEPNTSLTKPTVLSSREKHIDPQNICETRTRSKSKTANCASLITPDTFQQASNSPECDQWMRK